MSLFKKIWRGWFPWFMLEVQYGGKTKRIIVKEFKKKTPKHIKGINSDDELFELKSDIPMNYFIEEYRADLK